MIGCHRNSDDSSFRHFSRSGTAFDELSIWTRKLAVNRTHNEILYFTAGYGKFHLIQQEFLRRIRKGISVTITYVPQWWVEFDNELSWLFTNRFSAIRYMKDKRMGITEISKGFGYLLPVRQKALNLLSNQLIVELNSSLRHKIVRLT